MVIKNISACGINKPQVLVIGRQLENNYREFVFDCSDFGVEVTSIILVHQRSQDVAPYLVETSNTDTLTWTVTDTDTSYAGYGKAELRISFANGLAKSVTLTTMVLASITADTVIPSALQSWYDAMIVYIDEHSISPEELGQAIEDYLDEHPISAPVTSVNAKIGDVVLSASDVGALPSSTQIPTKTSDLVNDSGYITSAPVTSVNSKTGAVSLNASDVGALPSSTTYVSSFNGNTGAVTYSAPVTSVDTKTGAVTVIPAGGTTGQVLAKKTNADRDVEWVNQSGGGGAVDSVNGQTGTVVLDASDVGALPDSTTIDDVYWCTYGTTTSAQIETALTAGKIPMVKYQDYVYTLRFRNSATNHRFICNYGGKEKSVVCQSGTWMPNGDLTFLTSAVTSFNGNTGAVTYTAPVTSVNGQTGAVTVTDTDTTYSISISGNVITLTPSTGTAQTINLPADAVSSVDGKTGAVNVIPTGGTTGQVLSKASGTDYDVEWTTPQGGGGNDWTVYYDNTTTADALLQIPVTNIDCTEVEVQIVMPTWSSNVNVYAPLMQTDGSHWNVNGYIRMIKEIPSNTSQKRYCVMRFEGVTIAGHAYFCSWCATNTGTSNLQYKYDESANMTAGMHITALSVATIVNVPAGTMVLVRGR